MSRLTVPDQAEGLRRLFVADLRRMVALIGGRENRLFPAQLAVILAQYGSRVLLLDETLSIDEPHPVLGVTAQHGLAQVLHCGTDIADVRVSTPYGVHLIAGAPDAAASARPRMEARIGLVNGFYRLAGQYDIVLINASSQAFRKEPSLIWACQDAIIRCDDEPQSVKRAYAWIKALRQAGERRFHLLFESVDETQSQLLFRRLASVCRRHLQLMPHHLGVMPQHGLLPDQIAYHILNWPLPDQQDGHFPELMRRLLRGHQTVHA